LTNFIEYLTNRLSEPLPGEKAQVLMMPSLSDKSRFSLEAKKDAKPGGVMIMFYKKGEDWFFPLIQRPDYDGVHAKQMSFPGGKFDQSDRDLTHTALRETREEIGIPEKDIKVIGTLSELYIIASNFVVTPTIGYLPHQPFFIPDDHEVDAIEEIKLSDLLDEDKAKEKPLRIMQGVSINAPYFDLNNKVIWGATAMILAELKLILRPFFREW